MEINLILTANSWQLASQLDRSKPSGGVMFVKNIPERTYLALTPKQWQVLARFKQPATVPQVLEGIIEERICPPLSEFYELVLKAVRARILVAPDRSSEAITASNWILSLKPARLRIFLWVLFFAGFGFTVALHPELPTTMEEGLASVGVLAVAGVLGAVLSASLLRGAGGEVYVERGLIRAIDACMLPPTDQRTVVLAPIAMLSAATGLLTWTRPEWSFFPLAGLMVLLRPILRARVNLMIRVGAAQRLSDADHAYLFPPNRTPRARWKMLRASIRNPATWLEIGYGVIWTLLLGYFVGVLTEMPPWSLEFWRTRGSQVVFTVAGSLFLLAFIYASSEFYLFARERALARHNTMRQWWRRWFGRKTVPHEQADRLRIMRRSPLLRLLSPPEQYEIARVLQPHRAGPWRTLHDSEAPATHVSLILSGRVGVYRKLPSGRRTLMQVLCEDEIVGLHALADPERPHYLYRTLTPVVMLRMGKEDSEKLLLPRLNRSTIANLVLKLPFLARISLCQNWHMQAVTRFAELAQITDYRENEVMLQEGGSTENFFVMLEGEARISRGGKKLGTVRAGDFFGEIGLLQNSNATAKVVAGTGLGARSLCIHRREFLRFVAHNYSVALKLERVSSNRLGHPIFPLSPGNFRTI